MSLGGRNAAARVAVVTAIPIEPCPACGEVWIDGVVALRLDSLLTEMLATETVAVGSYPACNGSDGCAGEWCPRPTLRRVSWAGLVGAGVGFCRAGHRGFEVLGWPGRRTARTAGADQMLGAMGGTSRAG